MDSHNHSCTKSYDDFENIYHLSKLLNVDEHLSTDSLYHKLDIGEHSKFVSIYVNAYVMVCMRSEFYIATTVNEFNKEPLPLCAFSVENVPILMYSILSLDYSISLVLNVEDFGPYSDPFELSPLSTSASHKSSHSYKLCQCLCNSWSGHSLFSYLDS